MCVCVFESAFSKVKVFSHVLFLVVADVVFFPFTKHDCIGMVSLVFNLKNLIEEDKERKSFFEIHKQKYMLLAHSI